MRTQISTDLAPPPVGPYSQGIRVGNLLFSAGQGSFNDRGERVGETFAAQVEQAFDNLAAVAVAAGTGLEHMVKLGVFLRSLDNFETFNQIARNRLSTPYPARTTVPAPLVGFDVELDAVFLVPDDAAGPM